MALAIIYCAIVAIFGVIFCFFGYRHLKKLFIGLGFLIGSFVSYILLAPLMSPFLGILVSVLIGAVVGLLFYFLHVVGLFITGASFGALLVSIVCAFFGWDVTAVWGIIALCVIAILFGVLAVIFRRGLMIISTSFTGGYSVASNLGFLVGGGMTKAVTLFNLSDKMNIFVENHANVIVIIALILGVAGCIIQFFITAKGKGKK